MAGTIWACGEYESCLKYWSLECKVLVAQPCFFVNPWILTCQAPLYMRFPRKEHWSGLPFPPPGDIPNPGIKPGFPALQRQILYHLNQRASSFLNVGMVYKVMWGKKALSRTKEEVRLNGWYMGRLMGHVAHRVGCEDREGPHQSSSVGRQTLHFIPRAGYRVGALTPQIRHHGCSASTQVLGARCRATPRACMCVCWGERCQ